MGRMRWGIGMWCRIMVSECECECACIVCVSQRPYFEKAWGARHSIPSKGSFICRFEASQPRRDELR